jgi:iron(III) transport system substrate-binding protein
MKCRALILLAGFALASCSRSRGGEVVVYTSVDQVFAEPVLAAFEAKSGLKVRAVYDTEEAKSTGVLNRLLAESKRPQADVFWSGDPVRPFALIDRGLVEPYLSPAASDIPAPFKAPDGTWTGFAARARVLLVNTAKVAPDQRPRSLRDLTGPRWKGQVALANPVFGTTTMHVSALFVLWGDDRAKTFMAALKANDARLASSNGEVKRLVVSGEVSLGLTDTDDANEATKEGAPVEAIYPDQDGDGTLLMPTAVVLIKGSPHQANGRMLIDFLVSAETETLLAGSAAQMPVRPGARTPAGVRNASTVKAASVDYHRVAAAMERLQPWLREWAGM